MREARSPKRRALGRSRRSIEEAAQAQSGRAVHHLDAAAGGLAQARLFGQPHHAHRAALYEGIDIGEGSVGLITYMRTDSVNLAAEALTESARS